METPWMKELIKHIEYIGFVKKTIKIRMDSGDKTIDETLWMYIAQGGTTYNIRFSATMMYMTSVNNYHLKLNQIDLINKFYVMINDTIAPYDERMKVRVRRYFNLEELLQ